MERRINEERDDLLKEKIKIQELKESIELNNKQQQEN